MCPPWWRHVAAPLPCGPGPGPLLASPHCDIAGPLAAPGLSAVSAASAAPGSRLCAYCGLFLSFLAASLVLFSKFSLVSVCTAV